MREIELVRKASLIEEIASEYTWLREETHQKRLTLSFCVNFFMTRRLSRA